MDSRGITGQTDWIGYGVRKARVRGDSRVSDLQKDGWVGWMDGWTVGWMNKWKNGPFTQMGNLEREPYSKRGSKVGVRFVGVGKAYELNLGTF